MKEQKAAYRVMIVDDEAIQRAGIRHLCDWSQYGIEIVAQASNGEEALQYMDQARPHIVITDIVMPVMDGVEFAKIMRKQYPEIKLVVLSSYSEFDYVREVFKYGVTDYLLKPKVSAPELIALIQALCTDVSIDSVEQKPYKMDISLLLGEWLSGEGGADQEETWAFITQHFARSHYRIAKASTNLVLSRTKWTQSRMEEKLLELASSHLSRFDYVCVFLKNECLLLVNYDTGQAEAVSAELHRFTQEARQALTYLSFVLSDAFDSLRELKVVHERLTQCLGKLFYLNTARAAVPEHQIRLESDKESFDHTQFAAALRSLSIEKANAQLKAFFHILKTTQAYDEYNLKRFLQNLIYTVMSTLEHMKLPVVQQGTSKLQLFKQIDLAYDFGELEQLMQQFFDKLEADMLRPSETQHSVFLNQIYEYVNDNYASDISLSDLADKLHLNYSYLSSYFKQRTNENLTSFISRVRTEKAKELLLNPELSISQISRMTGFSEHNYFSKVFKKMTGMTPVEYRNQMTQ